MKKIFVTIALTIVLIFNLSVASAYAVCKDNFIDPITDVDWYAMFPIKIGGVTLVNSRGIHTPSDSVGNPICVCASQGAFGLKISLWEPFYIIEVVKDPWCSPTFGIQLSKTGVKNYGDSNEDNSSPHMKAEFHGITFPVMSLLNLFIDLPCFVYNTPTNSGSSTFTSVVNTAQGLALTIPFPSEVDAMWNKDTVSFLSKPGGLLFANPVAQLACIADAVASNISTPIDALYWCMGSWGSVYPVAGVISKAAYLDSVTGLVGRAIYYLSNMLLLDDRGLDYCKAYILPIWMKSHYRIQEFRPVVSSHVLTIGESSMLWGSLQSPTIATGNSPDNFAFIITRYDKCCSDTLGVQNVQ